MTTVLKIQKDLSLLNSDLVLDKKGFNTVFSKHLIKGYDLFILKFTSRLITNCDARKYVLEMYRNALSSNHLDIGPGSGYFLDLAPFPSSQPTLTLCDIHPGSIGFCMERLARYSPTFVQADVSIPFKLEVQFDSVGMNAVMHCVRGDSAKKFDTAFQNIAAILKPNGVFFGSTILGKSGNFNTLGRKLNDFYNSKGIFSNNNDTIEHLTAALEQHFKDVKVNLHGALAIFSARGK